jgi:hypothetical protein
MAVSLAIVAIVVAIVVPYGKEIWTQLWPFIHALLDK